MRVAAVFPAGLAAVLFAMAAAFMAAVPIAAEPLRIVHANVIDGTGRPVIHDTSILIRGGRIVEVVKSAAQEGETVIDAGGGYVLPGLMDGHTHLPTAPGGAYRKDAAAIRTCLFRRHLHGYLAAGVTGVLDNASSIGLVRRLRRYFAGGGIGPRVFYLAPFFTPPNGYFSRTGDRMETYADLWPPVKTREQVIAHLDKALPLQPVGVKVVIENGFGPLPVFDVFSSKMRAVIREEAAKRGMPLFIHSMSNDAHRMALGMKPRTLVHGLFFNETADPKVIRAIKKAGVFVVSTVNAFDFPQIQWRQSTLDDPLVKLTVPALEIATARNPRAWRQQNEALAIGHSPSWVPRFVSRLALGVFYGQNSLKKQVNSGQRDIKRLYDAGVPVVMGSDSGNWPGMIAGFHGPGSIREMELLAAAGIPPLETIRAATQTFARMVGQERNLGTLEAGKVADLIVVRSSPLHDMRALRKLDWVVKDGVARRPREWMAAAPRCR
ncbi:MAG: amidohydrolase family protein [bacterium]